jgi:chromosome partitioning protein
MEGLGQILQVVERLKDAKINTNLELGGIIMTMYDIRTNLSKQVVIEVSSHFKNEVFNTVIPRSVRLSEAPSFGQSILHYDPHSVGSLAYRDLAKEVIQRFNLSSSL